MNKKIFASAMFALLATAFSSLASAAITYSNSVSDGRYAQDANAKVTPDGASVRGNDLIIKAGAPAMGSDIPAGAEVIVRLPKGLNFDGAPSYLVSPATANTGLTLIDGTEFEDPTLDDPGITLFDANADGGMDRAVVKVGAASLPNDELFIKVNVLAATGTKAGTYKASLIVNNGLANVQQVVDVVDSLAEPVSGSSGTALTSVDQKLNINKAVTTATIVVTIPKGTVGGKTITLTPQTGVQWAAAASSTVTVKTLSPVAVAPLGAPSVGTPSTTVPITITTTGSPLIGSLFDVQVMLTVDQVNSLPGAVGTRGVTVGGTLGLTGTAALVSVQPNGSTATLTKAVPPATNNPTDIVKGSTAPQTLPTITVKENFDKDAADPAGTKTITITAGTGLAFATDTSTITFNGGGSTWAGTAAVSGLGNTVLTLTITTNDPTKDLILGGIQATAGATASGPLSLTVGKPGAPDLTTAPNNTLVVANAVAVGTVDVKGPVKHTITGPGAAAVTSTVTLTETTYGAITKAAETQVQEAYLKITPVGGATIMAVTIGNTGYPSTAPVFAACESENVVGSYAWLCQLTGESVKITPTTSTVTVAINYKANGVSFVPGAPPAAVVGSTIDMDFGGNIGVSGTATVADVVVATSATKGTVPDLTPGVSTAQNLAPLTITQKFPGAIKAGQFRLIAPSGVTFNNGGSVVATSKGIITVTPTITATFNPNDTLVITTPATPGLTFTAQAVIGPNVTGWVGFTVDNGDINGANGAGITKETVNLAYADGTLGKVNGGDDIAVNIGFKSSNTITKGLAEYSAKSSDESIATATVSGSSLIVEGKAAGVATITVSDTLGQTDTVIATVSAGAEVPATSEGKIVKTDGSTSTATFAAGASLDDGASFIDTLTAGDSATVLVVITPEAGDVGKDGELFVALKSDNDMGVGLYYLDVDGNWQVWDATVDGLGAVEVAEPLASSHNVAFDTGPLDAGSYKLYFGYQASGEELVYTAKALKLTVE